MSRFRLLGAAILLSAVLAAPACGWAQISEPAAAEAQDPNFSIYSNDNGSFSRTMASQAPLGGASEPRMLVRTHRGNRATRAKRY
jgi:hypothetical protein